MNKITNEISDYCNLITNNFQLVPSLFKVQNFFEDIIKSVIWKSNFKNIKINLNLNKDCPKEFNSDA